MGKIPAGELVMNQTHVINLKRRICMKEKLKYALLVVESLLFCGLWVIPSFADDDMDLTWIKEKGNGTFDDATSSFKGLISSGYGFVMTVSLGLMAVFLIIAAVGLAGGSARTKDESKGKIFSVLIGCAIVAASVSIISLVVGIANDAF